MNSLEFQSSFLLFFCRNELNSAYFHTKCSFFRYLATELAQKKVFWPTPYEEGLAYFHFWQHSLLSNYLTLQAILQHPHTTTTSLHTLNKNCSRSHFKLANNVKSIFHCLKYYCLFFKKVSQRILTLFLRLVDDIQLNLY